MKPEPRMPEAVVFAKILLLDSFPENDTMIKISVSGTNLPCHDLKKRLYENPDYKLS